MSIHRKLQLLSAVGVALLAVLALVALGRVGSLADALAESERGAKALHDQLDGDMMHDALRGDVLEALGATSPDQLTTIAADVRAHAANLRERLGELQALGLEPAIAQRVTTVVPAADRYGRAAEDLVAAALKDRDAARTQLASFTVAFKDLEVQLGALGDAIAADLSRARSEADGAVGSSRVVIWVVFGLGIVLLAFVGLAISRRIIGSLKVCENAATSFGSGDLTVSANIRSEDETGRLATGLDTALGALRESLLGVRQETDNLTGVASELASISKDLATSSARSCGQATGAADSAGTVSSEIATVASGLEQMSTAAREVAANASRAATVAAEAVSLGDAATTSMESLKAASASIGTVVRSVADIAEQTNLLALNASIEAARAGESGKGFAVVAGEVKELARQSASATSRIGAEIERIQAEVAKAVEAIRAIGETIHTINQAQAGTAAAAEQQHATLADLTRAVHRVSDGSQEIARAIGLVATSADEGSGGASNVASAAQRLNALAAQVRERLNHWRLA